MATLPPKSRYLPDVMTSFVPSPTPAEPVDSIDSIEPTEPIEPAVPALTWPIFAGHGLEAVVTTRVGGVSAGRYASLNLSLNVGDDPAAVLANRRRAAATLGATPADLVFCEQVAGSGVAVVTAADRGRGADSSAAAIVGTDALITTESGPVLVIMVADCVPIVLFDPTRRILACVHAGWTGTVRGVTSAAVERLRTLGCHPADLLVGIGPSIHPDRYQVGADVVDAARLTFGPHLDDVVHPDGTGAWTFDLWRANLMQLIAAGVPAEQVQIAALDTGPGTPFFSHRSEGPCGRFAVLARITEESSE